MKSLIITLPLPPAEYSLNSRSHWAVKQNVNREAQDAVVVALNQLGWVKWDKPIRFGRAIVIFELPNRKVRDHDNMIPRCKPYWDGLVKAGVIYKDDITYLGWPEYSHNYTKPGKLVIHIEERA